VADGAESLDELAILVHLDHDVAPAHELALDVDLRRGGGGGRERERETERQSTDATAAAISVGQSRHHCGGGIVPQHM